ncbi:prenyltransferase [Amycolatopsis sp. K13G38]|uniref:Prenyltransferase n=1 Tax=Amycolatopsis acididurans TaxID=2724524 RepID=A0ABX1J8W7_9PSEU|nr:prenyltransferase [Amycolatopsis acididurans]NKQ56218.1 prenyltransferase [Amycolatopsis acididurans]
MRRGELAVPGILTPSKIEQTARSIALAQEPSGAIPWFSGGHTDPWDHVESAMALSAAGLRAEAEGAYEWSRRTQRENGSWPAKTRGGAVEDASADTNFCAYLAVGVWHHYLVTGDAAFLGSMWPSVRRAIDFVLEAQTEHGEIGWVRDSSSALLTGSSSIHHSLRCALAIAAMVDDPQPDWEVGLGRLAHVLRRHEDVFMDKRRYSMDWYYPVLGGAVRGEAGRARLRQRWPEFVVDGLGARCVDDEPWVTGAETCELALSLEAVGERAKALDLLAAMQHLREDDGSYWTGLVFADGKRWPEERTTWTGAAVILAADALSGATAGSGVFRGAGLPIGLPVTDAVCGCGDLSRVAG